MIDNGATRWLLRRLESLEPARPNCVRILTFHRVSSAERFADAMKYLIANHPLVSAEQLLAAWRRETVLPPRSVMVTFDDAYREFAGVAWPALRETGIPAVLFVPTAFPGSERPFWWDRVDHGLARADPCTIVRGERRFEVQDAATRRHTARELKEWLKNLPPDAVDPAVDELCAELGGHEPEPEVLDWSELAQLAAEGVTLASHTRTHPILRNLSASVVRDEVRQSLRDLETHIGPTLPLFAYPAGRFDAAAVRGVRDAEIELAFTMVRGANDLAAADPLRLRRIYVAADDASSELQARLVRASLRWNRRRPLPEAR